jgi:hypothetical protein
MILKYFRRKIWRKIGVLGSKQSQIMQKFRKTPFFSQKIGENRRKL